MHSESLFFLPRYYIGVNIFPEVLLNGIAGPDGNSLLLSLKLSVDVLVSSNYLNLRLVTMKGSLEYTDQNKLLVLIKILKIHFWQYCLIKSLL